MTTAAQILSCAEQGVVRRRQADIDDLEMLLAWADLHSGDPQTTPGGPKLISLGGDGTPQVQDLSVAEIAIARSTGVVSTDHAIGDALDLRHRLPNTWAGLRALKNEVWVGRKIARMTRKLSRDAVAVVDQAVGAAIEESPGRLLAIAEAKIIEADPASHAERVERDRNRRGVWLSEPRSGDLVDDTARTAGVRSVFGRLDDGDAVEFYEMVETVADALGEQGDYDPDNPPIRDQLRADAMALLADPEAALALLTGEDAGTRKTPRPKSTVYVHLSADAVEAGTGVARVDRLGPELLDQLARLLGRRDLTVTPVVDLNQVANVNAYEHPVAMKRRTELRTIGDVFPHSPSRQGARVDHDHCRPYNKAGPPGQTSDTNDGPLTRRHHRMKTHTGMHVEQLQLGVYRWTAPHGLARMVTPRGTKKVELLRPDDKIMGELYFS